MEETVFRNQGSLDDYSNEIKGHEFTRIMKYFSNKPLLAFTIIFSIIAGVMPLFFAIFMGDMLNIMNENTDFIDQIKKVIIKILLFTIAEILSMTINMQLRLISIPCFMRDLRKHLFHALLEKDITYFDKVPTGVMAGRISQDVTLINEIFIDKLCTALQMLSQSAGGIIVTLVTMWQVGLIGIASLFIAGMIYVIGDRIVVKIWVEYNESASSAASKAEEIISSFRTIKSFDCELKESELYKKQIISVDNVFKKTSIAQGTKDGLISLILNGVQAAILYYACWMIQMKPNYGYVSGDLFIVLMSLSMASMGVSSALTLSDDFKKTSISAAKILDIIETPPDVDRKKGDSLQEVKGKIEFRDVTFKYQSADTNAVEHLSFIINPGETVAFVGESGCGKSTTLQLIQRFYDIDSGTILLDDVDMKTLSPVFIRSQISIVPQSPVLFSMSILDNIRYANPDKYSDIEVAQAAKVGNAHDFIMEIPRNYLSQVQQTSLSGGQKQRICISRSILANTPILLLDEATAALDTESERLVQQSLEKFRKGKTAILVAHRLATVMNADRILVFSEGSIIEEGTHESLLKKNGIYADLVKFQLQ